MLELRVATAFFLLVLDSVLARLVKPDRREFRAAATTALIVAAGDFAVESLMGSLGVWEYDLPGKVAGLPVDVPPDLGMVTFAFCMGLGFAGREGRRPHIRTAYVLLIALAVGTEAWIKNRDASRKGWLTFGGGIDEEGVTFAIGNYVAIAALLLLITVVYDRIKSWLPAEGE